MILGTRARPWAAPVRTCLQQLQRCHASIRANPQPLRVGIIGAGRIGQVHAQGLQRTNAEVKAISDVNSQAAEQTAARFGITKWSTSADDIVGDASIDAIVICSPTDKHAEQIIQAAKHNKHIFCEKPIDLEVDVVNKALAAVEEAGVKLMVGFNRRFDANFQRIKRAIDTDEIGRVNMFRITSRDPSAPPIEYVRVSGGMFRDMTIHDFDMARFLVGDEVDEVYALAQSRDAAIAAAGDIDTAVCLLKFKNGVIGYIENSREAAYGYDQRVEVLGTKGSVACDNNHANNVVVSTSASVQRDLPLHFFLERYMDAYVTEMQTFIRVCTQNEAVPVGGEDGREALLLAIAANQSRLENRPVKLDERRRHCALEFSAAAASAECTRKACHALIADPIDGVAKRFATDFRIPRWTKSVDEVIGDASIDAIVICSPTDKHAEQIIQAAKHNKHIFCEKPIDLEVDVVNKALAAVEEAGVKLMVGFNRRFDANFQRIKRAIDTDEIGRVNMFRITSRDPSAPPIEYVRVSGGMFRDMTIHDFDMARFLVGDEVDEVYALAQSRDAAIAAAGDIDTAVCLLKFKNGVIGYIENSREAAYGYDQRVEVLGTKGSVACDNNHANNVVVSTSASVQRDLPLHFFLERYMDAYVTEMQTFIRVCTQNEAVPVGGEDGREALLLAIAANQSRLENRPVKLDEVRARMP
ncbi:TPA: hypothetical protein N0F65_011238 [Lagenidium giganteum]|uniref:Inositol 2-dehydrogenase n=1 Tax=Lagenidium giganteum TaxID=4803 RepID=A0AAV2Z045_9STRA|nr:TPA: hypothetical protein N0F65_011238 [Lagenidium giganteum]